MTDTLHRALHRALSPAFPPALPPALPPTVHRAACVVLCMLTFGGCGDEEAKTDAGNTSGLYPCNEPNRSCNAHDPCAINPVCGEDLLCHPEAFQNCDDGLECTEDICGGMGACNNEPKEGFCALLVKDPGGGPSEVKCFPGGTQNPEDPCETCTPTERPTKWSPANGGACDDEDPCTLDDHCVEGFCEGNYYGNECSDGLGCTGNICDGLGGCSNPMREGWCLIVDTCIAEGNTDPSGCLICDVEQDVFRWTTLTDICVIDGLCYMAGVFDTTGCGVCDPAGSTDQWSSAPGICFIEGACVADGEKNADECGTCDSVANSAGWTPVVGKCLINDQCLDNAAVSPSGCNRCDATLNPTTWTVVAGASSQVKSFDTDLEGYTIDPLDSGVGWQLGSTRAISGAQSLYYGNPATMTYDTGGLNQGTAQSAAVVLPAGQKAALRFWLYMDTETNAVHDSLSVSVNGTLLWTKSADTMPPESFRKWVEVEIDLSSFAGQSVTHTFSFETKDDWANFTEGVFIDDVALITNCGS